MKANIRAGNTEWNSVFWYFSITGGAFRHRNTKYNIGTDTDTEWMISNDLFRYPRISSAVNFGCKRFRITKISALEALKYIYRFGIGFIWAQNILKGIKGVLKLFDI